MIVPTGRFQSIAPRPDVAARDFARAVSDFIATREREAVRSGRPLRGNGELAALGVEALRLARRWRVTRMLLPWRARARRERLAELDDRVLSALYLVNFPPNGS